MKGGRSTVTGIAVQLDDASLQQFVNGKTNRPVDFRYRAYSYEGRQVGIIEIPMQDRPTYLTKDYLPLRKHIVYVRRGSSTAEADPTEIARMGAAQAGQETSQLELNVNFADVNEKTLLGNQIEVESLHLSPRVDADLLKPPSVRNPFGYGFNVGIPQNSRFYEELVEFVASKVLLNEIGLAVQNKSQRPARGVELVLRVSTADGLHMVDDSDRPTPPDRMFSPRIVGIGDRLGRPRPTVNVSRRGSAYEIAVRWETILPGATGWSDGVFLVGAERSQEVRLTGTIFAEDLPVPVKSMLHIDIVAKTKPMELGVLKRLLGERDEES